MSPTLAPDCPKGRLKGAIDGDHSPGIGCLANLAMKAAHLPPPNEALAVGPAKVLVPRTTSPQAEYDANRPALHAVIGTMEFDFAPYLHQSAAFRDQELTQAPAC